MFRPMRRSRQSLPREEGEHILLTNTAGILSVYGDDGYPYGVPLSYVYDNGIIYFHSAPHGHKIDAILRNSKASFCVIDKDELHPERLTTYFRSVIAFGKATIVSDDNERLAALRLLANRYAPGCDRELEKELSRSFHHTAVIRLDITHMSAKEAIELVRQKA